MSNQSRRYFITINNPAEKGLSHENIMERLNQITGLKYVCMADEIGNETGTYHTHVFVIYENPKKWKTIFNLFSGNADIRPARKTSAEVRNYVLKSEGWAKTEKAETSVEGTFEEHGDFPQSSGSSADTADERVLYELIKDGRTNAEILEEFPQFMYKLSDIDKCRLTVNQAKYASVWRDVEVIYIRGDTGVGKSRYVMEKYGYENVFRVTDSVHPWDTYQAESVVVFEEFNSSFVLQRMLNWLDGYPVKLEARYCDKQACFSKVYILSNLSLSEQYKEIQQSKPEVWNAFLRRISYNIHFFKDGVKILQSNTSTNLFTDEGFISGSPRDVLDEYFKKKELALQASEAELKELETIGASTETAPAFELEGGIAI